MVQATEPWHASHPGLHRSALCSRCARRRLLCKPKMCSVVVVVADIFGHEAFEMAFVENDDVIEQVSAATTHKAFGNAVLPRAAEAGAFGLDAEALDRVDHLFAEVRGAVEDQILRCRVVRESLAQLLRDPRARRTPCDAEVRNPPSIMRSRRNSRASQT